MLLTREVPDTSDKIQAVSQNTPLIYCFKMTISMMWDDDLAPFWIIKNLFLSAKSSWSYSFGCWGWWFHEQPSTREPKRGNGPCETWEMGLKCCCWVWAELLALTGVQCVHASWELGILVANLNKSVPNQGEQGYEEIFPSDEISFACSSINECVITSF